MHVMHPMVAGMLFIFITKKGICLFSYNSYKIVESNGNP